MEGILVAQLQIGKKIRAFRKARGLTQEQLAQALGVTAGAVYKWEAELSAPDLSLLVALADFFDTSVDVLLGYELRDNRESVTAERLQEYRRQKDPAGLAEAERALLKYPNSFAVVHAAAQLYFSFGIAERDRKRLGRARALFERLLLLLGQNHDPKIGEASIWGALAQIELLEAPKHAVEIMQAHNEGGMFNADLGYVLASSCELPDEAAPYLSEAMLDLARSAVMVIMGWLNVYLKQEKLGDAEKLLHWGLELFTLLTREGKTSFLTKVGVMLHTMLAYLALRQGNAAQARAWLETTRNEALRFDAAPTYSGDRLRYVSLQKPATTFDDLGATAMESVQRLVHEELTDAPELQALWQEVCEDGEN